MFKISIIVPVYKAEKFLFKCVDSILAQTEKKLELILVDDGSPDSSGAICDQYAQNDNRVKVIHKRNEGVSIARNAGIDVATGEYIGFVDSDDWIDTNMFETLLYEAQKTASDIVMCDATTVYSNGREEADTITQLTGNKIITKQDLTPQLLLEFAGSVCRCIYSTKLVKSNSIHFPLGVRFSEDRIFNILAMGYANQIFYMKTSYYNRFINIKSTIHQFHPDYFEVVKLSADETQRAIDIAWNADKNYKTAYLNQFISGSLMSINNYYYKTSTLTAKQRKQAVKNVCEDKRLQAAITKSGYGGRQGKWIISKNIMMLIVYAKVSNWKNKR